jgi:hypothetical protein
MEAAVEHLAPPWRQANTYPHLVNRVRAGSPEELGRGLPRVTQDRID